MKKTATLIALAGLSMAANPEQLHGSFRNRKFGDKPFVAHKPSKQSETLNADDELLLIYKPRYNIDPGMVIRPPRGYDIDPGMVKRPPYGDIDQGIFVKPRTTPQVMWADDDELFSKGVDAGMVIKPKRGDIDPKMVIKPKRGDIDPKIILNPKKDVIYADDELVYVPTMLNNIQPMRAVDDELMVYLPKELRDGPARFHLDDDEFFLDNKEFNKGIDAGMVIKPKRGDIDPKMVIKPKRGVIIDPKIILNPKKDVIYADDELAFASTMFKPYVKPTLYADDELFANDDELMVYVPKEKDVGPMRQHRDDELFSKGVDAGMVIKPKRGDIDPKMIIKPKRGDIDPKIILNPKKDVIYADDEFVYIPTMINKIQPMRAVDDELVVLADLLNDN